MQWRINENGIFEYAKKETSMLSTLSALQEVKNWYFSIKILCNIIFILIIYGQLSKPKDLHKKRYVNTTNLYSYEKNSIPIENPINFDNLLWIEIFYFAHEIFVKQPFL